MAHTQFEPSFPGAWEGTADVDVMDAAGVAPNRVIQTDDAWSVDVEWEIDGFLASLTDIASGAEWTVSVYAESLGGGAAQEKQIGTTQTVNFTNNTPSGTARQYSASIMIPTHSANPAQGLPAGAYRLVTIILARKAAAPNDPLPQAAFVDGPVVHLYDPS